MRWNVLLFFIIVFFPLTSPAFQYEYAQPSYDSGWNTIAQNETKLITHNLGGNVNNYVVDLQIRSDRLGSLNTKQVHIRFSGGNSRNGATFLEGIMWNKLNSGSITIWRLPNDDFSHEYRLRIWKKGGADFDSGWQNFSPGQSRILPHDLGGNSDEYVVYMESQSQSYGVHQMYQGGTKISGVDQWVGTQWAKLTTSNITVVRLANDIFTEKIRVRIWKVKLPDYDSGWQPINQGQEIALSHGINSPFSDYSIYLEFKDTDNLAGINQLYYGGVEPGTEWLGAYISDLTGSTVTLYRNVDDLVADQMRVRVWKSSKAKYDSGWKSILPNENIDLAHGIGGSVTDDYIVSALSRHSSGAVHNRFYGGSELYVDQVLRKHGYYWSRLTGSNIRIHRESDDIDTEAIRIRMWIPPKADFDSGWHQLQSLSETLNFSNLGGNTDEYYVYIEGQVDGFGAEGRTIFHIGSDTYFSNGSFTETGFHWSNLTTSSIQVHFGGFIIDSVRVRIWKNGGKTDVHTIINPQGLFHRFNVSELAGTEYIYDLQMDYSLLSGTSNKSIGNIYSGASTINFFGASFSKINASAIDLAYGENQFDALRLYSWNISWQPKQKIPSSFPWIMFINNFVNGSKK